MKRNCQSGKRNNRLLLVAVFCIVTLVICSILLSHTPTAQATSVANNLGEIWDSTEGKFNQKASLALYEALGGTNVTGTGFQDKFTSLKNWASTPRTSADFRTNSGHNVTVTLGGKQWVATYLTVGNTGDLVLTLLLAERATALSTFNSGFAASSNSVCTYPSDSYGSSFIRASLNSGNPAYLNNASDTASVSSYVNAQSASSLTAMTAATDLGLEFASFTTGALSSYILTPEQVGYQELLEIGRHTNPTFYNTSNDAYGNVSNTNFYAAQYNYYTNVTVKTDTYIRWKQDKIWISSLAELGFNDSVNGLWKTDLDLRNVTGSYYITRTSGYGSYAEYYFMQDGNTHDQKYASVSTRSGVRPAIHLNLSATANSASSGISKPSANNTSFTYNNAQQTYEPKNFDDKTMDITGNKQKNVKILDGSTEHEADPDGYEVVVTPKSGFNWYGNSTDPIKFKFIIKKADPVITVTTNPATLPDPMYESYGLPKLTASGTPGTIKFDDNQTPSASITEYNWTFTPTDLDNYNVKKDKMKLTYTGKTASGIKVVVKDNVEIYDKYDTNTYATFADYIKSRISVYATYTDGSTDASPLPNASYNVTTTQAQIAVGSGLDVDNKSISVRVTATGSLQNRTGSVTAEVKKAKIQAMSVYEVASPETLKYPVTLDDIKANYEVFLTWNFEPTLELKAQDSFVSVAVKETTDNPDGKIKAGTVDLVFKYKDGDLEKTAEFTGCVIAKGDIDMSGVTFADKSEMYDGTAKSIAISGTLPTGVTGVTYTCANTACSGGCTSAGTHTITAKFTYDSDNYNSVADMTATLTIANSGFDMTGVTFANDTLTYDGNGHTLEISGTLPDNRITITYVYEKGGVVVNAPNGVTDAGVYTVTAKFTNPDPANYADIPDMTATLTINKATFDMSGVTFEDKTVTENGTTSFTLEITGNLPHPSIVVTYTVSGTSETSFKTAGVYEFTASFSNPDPTNYNNIADMTATLTVEDNPDVVEPTPTPPPSNNGGLLEKIRELIDSGFPLWQICTMAVAGLLAIIFLIKSVQYGNRRKKVANETKKIKSRAYVTFLPVFATDMVLAGLSNQVWSIMAFSFVGLALIMFLTALITRSAWKKAELAKENALEEREMRKYEAQENKQLALQERITQIGQNGVTVDNSIFEQRLLEMEARHREEMARRDEEMARRDEEQAKRDEAMKIMLAKMMGRAQGDDSDMPYYGTVDDTDLLVQKVIAGLLPAVQQMIPENTAYLTAPAYENDEKYDSLLNKIDTLQQQISDMNENRVEAEIIPDNSEEIKALTDEVKDLKKQLEKGAKSDNNVDVDELAQKVSEKIVPTTTNTTIVQDVSDEKMQALNAKIAQMQQQMDSMAFLSVDELDDTDFDDEEEWDSILDEDDDDFVEAVIIEEGGTVRKTTPNFRMRLKQSSEKNREWYAVIKNMFCSQKGVTYRVCKRVEKIRYQGQVVGVIGIAKRSIKLWLALKPYEYDARRYHHKDVSDKPRFVDVPMYIRVGSDRALTRAQELILALFQELNMEARKRYNDRDIQELIFTLKHNKLLTNKQNKQLLCEVMHVHDCDVLSDELAEKCIEVKNVADLDDSLLATVKLDDIDAKFQDGNRVTLDKLKKVGLVSEECTGFTVTADKRLTKPLIIVANDFSLTAVKLITLTGGRAIKLAQV